ncbi:MAG: TMEM165/GDT1 family protein [Endomicrobium sp.]|jgi:putative Ca2+/H+ antiporter (TMEM165/GDT1 family)|nr:TMEM165/GDT1 family protein [Endomicrobium sp.]
MTSAFLTSFLLIFIAEMGDKTQLAALAFTARFKTSQVIVAIAAATALTNLIAVCAGGLISDILPVGIIKTASYVLFILFGLWTLLDKNEDEKGVQKKVIINPFFTVAILFFISEFGDKTQIAAMTLAMNENPIGVFFGAFSGMFLANLLGIAVGLILGKKLPAKTIKYIAASLFIIIGTAGLILEAVIK